MKAIAVRGDKEKPVLVWEDIADTDYGPDEVLVDVRATAVNRADLSQARGNYPPPPGASQVLGLEMVGVVAEVGASVAGWRPGDRVRVVVRWRLCRARCRRACRHAVAACDGWSFAQGAAVPEVWYTAFINLFG